MIAYTVPSMFGGVVYGVLFLGLAVFVFLQRRKNPALGKLSLVAAGLALWGLFYVLAVPFDLIQGILSYGALSDVVRVADRLVSAVGQMGGYALVTVGAVLTAADLAGPSVEAPDEPLPE